MKKLNWVIKDGAHIAHTNHGVVDEKGRVMGHYIVICPVEAAEAVGAYSVVGMKARGIKYAVRFQSTRDGVQYGATQPFKEITATSLDLEGVKASCERKAEDRAAQAAKKAARA